MLTPDQRQKDPDQYFTHEYEQIHYRRNQITQTDRPSQLTGLAFSGGGIRSAAYQLGILSGLHETEALKRIDYLSAVSGGSWAAGSYWASTESDDNLFSCLVLTAKSDSGNGNEDCDSSVLLNNEQPFATLPVKGAAIKARKRQWRDYIKSVYLPECNVDAAEIERIGINELCVSNYRKKPYLIINASHSVKTLDQKGSPENVPFHFTMDEIGALTDCHKTERCDHKESKGFFVKNISDDFAWINKSLIKGDKAYNNLAAAMAASSAVVSGTVLLSYHYELAYKPRLSMIGNMKGDRIEEIRERYELSDGGKSDNLGLVPLIERGVENIVISYMGKDNDPVGDPWEDFKIAKEQAEKLFGCKFTMPDADASVKNTVLFESVYECGEHKGKITHVKSTHNNVGGFIEKLKDNGSPELHEYLTNKDSENYPSNKNDLFPQTPTMQQAYDQQLIDSYFLLGRWVAIHYLSGRLME
jgi:hypothetical protein